MLLKFSHNRLGLNGKSSIEYYQFQGTTRYLQQNMVDTCSSLPPFSSSNSKEDVCKFVANYALYLKPNSSLSFFLFVKIGYKSSFYHLCPSDQSIEVTLCGHSAKSDYIQCNYINII